jgi:hypothetical protein
MLPAKKKLLLFLGIFAVLLMAYFVLRVAFMPHTAVPQEFSEARARGAVIGQTIVDKSNDIAHTVNSMNELEKQGKTEEELADIATVRAGTKDIRTLAIDLSKEVGIMNAALPSIGSGDAEQAALDSISNWLALISRLVTYTDEIDKLMNALELHLKKGVGSAQDIQRLVNEVNGDVNAVNAFNRQATQAMERFDRIVR